MLSPVSVVSANSTNLSQRETTVAVPLANAVVSAPDAAVALALAASSEVEGKLNILLIGARERMIDSLFAVVDAVSKALNMQQAAGETNVAFAQRLADNIGNLTPKQAAAVQAQLNAQGPTASLMLIARALQNPAGTEAAQVVAYMEVLRYKERDLATKAVVASYGQNGADESGAATKDTARTGNAQPAPAPPKPSGAGQPQAQMSTPLQPEQTPRVTADKMATAASTLGQATANAVEHQDAPIPADVGADPAQKTVKPLAEGSQLGRQPAPAAGNATAPGVSPLQAAVQSSREELAVLATALPGNGGQGAAADAKTVLKAVVIQLANATGAQLLQTMAEVEPVAAKVVAQALVADMLDSAEIETLPSPDETAVQLKAGTASQAASSSQAASAGGAQGEELASLAALNRLLAQAPNPAIAPLSQQLPLQAQLSLGVPFAVGQYPLAEDISDEDKGLHIDRVNAIGDDEAEARRQARNHGDEAADEQPEPEEGDKDPHASALAEADGTEPAATETAVAQRTLALPRPAPMEPFREPVANIYQRLGGWD